MSEERKEYVSLYLPASQAKRLKDVTDGKIDGFIEEYIAESKRELKISLDAMDDDIVTYKAGMISAKKEFQEAKDEALKANWDLWDEFDDQQKSIRAKSEECVKELKPLTDELLKISNLLSNIKKWEIEGFLEMINDIKSSLYGENGNIIKFLIENYKRPE